MEQDYYIIYASKTELDIVQDWSWEKDYYNLASRESFSKQISAIKYAKELAEENN